MEYALVNIVMGDEGGEESALKKGFKNILMGARTTPPTIQVNVISFCLRWQMLFYKHYSFQLRSDLKRRITYEYFTTIESTDSNF